MQMTGLHGWLLTVLLPILIIGVGITIMARSGQGNWRKTFHSGGVALVGLVFVAMGAVAGAGLNAGTTIFHWIFG
jgi:uncharacterized membrane protein